VFFYYISEVQKESSLRPFSHLCEQITIYYYKNYSPLLKDLFTQEHKTVMTEACFDWMIGNKKVATQVRAMTSLYFLGTEFDWIHLELKQIIEQNIHDGSAGYKVRGRKTIEKINSFRKI
jgi:hypothetical protein